MLTLDLTNAPRWHDLAPGVRVQLRPLTTALMVATRSDPAVEAVPGSASMAASLRDATISAVVSGSTCSRTPWPRSSQRGSEIRPSRIMISSPRRR